MTFKILGDPTQNNIGNPIGRSGKGGFQWNQFLDFEGGNIVTPPVSAWDTTGGAGVVTVLTTAVAAIRGNFGAEIGIPGDGINRYGILNGMNNETQGIVQFLFDPNSITMANTDDFTLIRLNSTGAGGIISLLLLSFTVANGYFIQLLGRNDIAISTVAPVVNIADRAMQIRLVFKRSSAVGADDGYFRLYIDGVMVSSIENFDNDTQDFTELLCGAAGPPAPPPATVNGALYFDDVSWTNQLVI